MCAPNYRYVDWSADWYVGRQTERQIFGLMDGHEDRKTQRYVDKFPLFPFEIPGNLRAHHHYFPNYIFILDTSLNNV